MSTSRRARGTSRIGAKKLPLRNYSSDASQVLSAFPDSVVESELKELQAHLGRMDSVDSMESVQHLQLLSPSQDAAPSSLPATLASEEVVHDQVLAAAPLEHVLESLVLEEAAPSPLLNKSPDQPTPEQTFKMEEPGEVVHTEAEFEAQIEMVRDVEPVEKELLDSTLLQDGPGTTELPAKPDELEKQSEKRAKFLTVPRLSINQPGGSPVSANVTLRQPNHLAGSNDLANTCVAVPFKRCESKPEKRGFWKTESLAPKAPAMDFADIVGSVSKSVTPSVPLELRGHLPNDSVLSKMSHLRQSSVVQPDVSDQGIVGLTGYILGLGALTESGWLGSGERLGWKWQWSDICTDKMRQSSDPTWELSNALFQLGALHSRLGLLCLPHGDEAVQEVAHTPFTVGSATDGKKGLLSPLRNAQSKDGLRRASSHFQRAAGVFRWIRLSVLPSLDPGEPLVMHGEKIVGKGLADSDLSRLEALEKWQLAQACECFYYKAWRDHSSDSTLSRLAAHCADLYQAAAMGKFEWVSHLKAKMELYAALAHFHAPVAVVDDGDDLDGVKRVLESGARLRMASRHVDRACKLASGSDGKVGVVERVVRALSPTRGHKSAWDERWSRETDWIEDQVGDLCTLEAHGKFGKSREPREKDALFDVISAHKARIFQGLKDAAAELGALRPFGNEALPPPCSLAPLKRPAAVLVTAADFWDQVMTDELIRSGVGLLGVQVTGEGEGWRGVADWMSLKTVQDFKMHLRHWKNELGGRREIEHAVQAARVRVDQIISGVRVPKGIVVAIGKTEVFQARQGLDKVRDKLRYWIKEEDALSSDELVDLLRQLTDWAKGNLTQASCLLENVPDLCMKREVDWSKEVARIERAVERDMVVGVLQLGRAPQTLKREWLEETVALLRKLDVGLHEWTESEDEAPLGERLERERVAIDHIRDKIERMLAGLDPGTDMEANGGLKAQQRVVGEVETLIASLDHRVKALGVWVNRLQVNGSWVMSMSAQRAKELTKQVKSALNVYAKWRVQARSLSDACLTLRAVTAHLLVDLIRSTGAAGSPGLSHLMDPLVRQFLPCGGQPVEQPAMVCEVDEQWDVAGVEGEDMFVPIKVVYEKERGRAVKRKPAKTLSKSVFDQQRDIFNAAIGQLEHAKSVTAVQLAENGDTKQLRQKSSQRLVAIQRNLEGIQRSLSKKSLSVETKPLPKPPKPPRIVTNFD